MAFQYQMQKILDVMTNREKALDGEVASARAEFEAQQAKLDELDMRRAAAQKGLNTQMAAGATADVAASNDYIQVMTQRAEVQARAVKAAQAVLDQKKEKLRAAKVERNKIEKHKEIKHEAWKVEQKKKEAKRTDEMAGTIFMKRRAAIEESNREEAERLEKIQKYLEYKALQEKRKGH